MTNPKGRVIFTREKLLSIAPIPPHERARQIAREMFGPFEDDDGSEAERCFCALERMIDHMMDLAEATSPPASAAGDSGAGERETFEAHIAKDCGDLSTFGVPPNRHYRNSYVNHEWIGWQARAALATKPQAEQEAATKATPVIARVDEADMFWDHDDPERYGHDIGEIVQDYGPGEVVTIDQAKRLPSITVRVLPGEHADSYLEYEIVGIVAASNSGGVA